MCLTTTALRWGPKLVVRGEGFKPQCRSGSVVSESSSSAGGGLGLRVGGLEWASL